ncbi:MAG: patatin-like phospholipase family protein [bacterium]
MRGISRLARFARREGTAGSAGPILTPQEERDERCVRILSLDGGGVRGLISAGVLVALEREIRERSTLAKVVNAFDLVVGTSIGGILALGLAGPAVGYADGTARPASARHIRHMLLEYLPQVFGTRRDRVFTTLGHAIATKYANGTRYRLLHELFQSLHVRDAVLPCAVTAYDTQRREPVLLRSYGVAPLDRAPTAPVVPEDFYMADAAFATSAAPTYFPPALIHSLADEESGRESREFSLVDGGLFANNPAIVAYTEAKKVFPWAARFIIASLGTGITDKPYEHDEIRRWGFVDWVAPHHNVPLLSMMMDGQSDSALEMLVNLDRVELFRFDTDLQNAHTRMDNATPENLEYLVSLGDTLAKREQERLGFLASKLLKV